jgi:hypothetical protein
MNLSLTNQKLKGAFKVRATEYDLQLLHDLSYIAFRKWGAEGICCKAL